ncbi:hypothetical protein CKO25_17905 [Thiocapsa imhoffii]|uniref:FlgO domain-containing protein n=1 Tax=Thiocapsa imhoffii TaxID=382777 RepID=A0A9X0WLA5_9GAMM|nr:FlgO family outer membrane protein [Thiocapsa imhoffii]MBK1646485.1 hypothetical protein [Thiocapsa imhoffii]
MKPILVIVRGILMIIPLLSVATASASDIHRELDDITKRLALKIEESQRSSVAVADFTDLHGSVSQLGRFVSEEISTNMGLDSRGFSVIDRNHLRTILKEQKLSMSGLMIPENQKKVGKILGVDCLILGSITPFGENYRINLKVIDVETAKVVVADRSIVAKTPATDELWLAPVQDDSIMQSDIGHESNQKPTKQTTTVKGEFKNQFLSLAIESFSVNREKTSATIVVTLTNISDSNIYVGGEGGVTRTTLVDDEGGLWVRSSEITGIRSYPWNYSRCNKNRKGAFDEMCDNWATLMTPGQSLPINISFKPEGNVRDPGRFSFSTGLHIKTSYSDEYGAIDWKWDHTGIGISGIALK